MRQRNTKELITNHKGKRMLKDGEDSHGLQTTNLKTFEKFSFSTCAKRDEAPISV